jgi:4-amino-4-deoxy-L-arabinose transferase-like glycosyltransferase
MSEPRWPPRLLPAAAAFLALWSLAPLAVLWDNSDPAYFTDNWQRWLWGSVVAGILLVVAMMVSRGRADAWLQALWHRVMAIPERRFTWLAALLLAMLSLLCCLFVFDANPRNVDGFAQLFQARMFLSGHLWVPVPAELANFATLQMILGPDRWYSQYPPGQSLVLAMGLLAGGWWLLNPLIAVVFSLATYRVARWIAGESVARLAVLVLCVSPFVVAVAGSEMSHLGAAAIGMSAAAAATLVLDRRSLGWAAVCGLLLGIMTSFRPLDAVAAAMVCGLMGLAWSPRRVLDLAAMAAGGILGSIPTLWFNARTTGSPTKFGYTALWGPQHSLGFHPVPFGIPLTLTRAIARSGMDLHQLNVYMLDSTIPVLVLVAAGYIVGRADLRQRDGVAFAGIASLVGLLFFYWHRDVFYGPRFLYSIVAWFAIVAARAIVAMARSGRPGRIACMGALAALVVGSTFTPGRVEAYRRTTPMFSLHPDRDAARARISHAVVVIPDGWGTRLIARMWAAGIPVRRSTRIYAAIDACTLELALDSAERDTTARENLGRALDSLASLRRPGVPARLTDDENLRLIAGSTLAAPCAMEVVVDRRGYYSYAPFLWLNNASLDGNIVWARDLGPRNAALFTRYAGRRFYRYAPGGPDRAPVLLPLDGPGW